MNTNVCFVFLLVIGLSAQRSIRSAKESEFEVDFKAMVKTVRLEGERTLLDCSENCDEVKETACKCVHFNHCMNGTVYNCIKTGLLQLNLKGSSPFHLRLMRKEITHEGTCQWHTLVSPRCFLNYIMEVHQKSNALG